MTTATFHPARLHGIASAPPAKSEAHRALLLAALGRGICRLHGFSLCDDTRAMLSGIAAMGAGISWEGDVLVIEPAPLCNGAEEPTNFHVNACAAALRMLIPAFWARGQAVCITMEDALFARPLTAFTSLAERIQAQMTLTPPREGSPAMVELSGKLDAGAYEIDGSLSSQFASGLLIALSHATDSSGHAAPSTLTVTRPIVSRPYLDMTLAQMTRYHIPYEETEEGVFALPPPPSGGQVKSPHDIDIAGDWSQAAVLLCANAMGSGVMVRGLHLPKAGERALQGDARILDVMRQMGLSVYEAFGELYVTNPSRPGLMPIQLDCADIPDLAPILALTCSQARGASTLTGVKRLRAKECDRLAATEELLERLGVRVWVSPDSDTLTIEGQGHAEGPPKLRGGFAADARGDHRIVMLLATAALIADAPITVTGVESLNKSWPEFMKTYQALGGMIS